MFAVANLLCLRS